MITSPNTPRSMRNKRDFALARAPMEGLAVDGGFAEEIARVERERNGAAVVSSTWPDSMMYISPPVSPSWKTSAPAGTSR